MGFDKMLQLGSHIPDVSAALAVGNAVSPIPFAPDRDARDDVRTMEDDSLSRLPLQEYFGRLSQQAGDPEQRGSLMKIRERRNIK